MASTARTAPTAPTRPRLTALKPGSARLGLPYTTTRAAGLRGEFPLVRVGRALYAEWDDLDRWVDSLKGAAQGGAAR